MRVLTFRGGAHPFDGKKYASDQPIRTLAAGKELAFLTSQHIGAPAKACVKKGDHVLAGQLIAEAGSFVSAPVHSSVSGTVKGIEKRRNATGDFCDAVIIENDGQYQSADFTKSDLRALSKEEILAKIREAGVVGMGGAGFPTAVKLSPKEPDKIDYILVNGAECEPYLTSDYRCMVEEPDRIISGLKCILKLFDHAFGVICIEDNKPEAIRVMSRAAEGENRIRVQVLKTKYPEGGERCLINAVTGRELNSGMLPADAGCIVDNVATVMAVYDAVIDGKPVMNRVFTVSGDAPCAPGNFRVPIGMYYSEIAEAAGGFSEDPEKIISGGPMMGFAVYDLRIPVTKTSGGITCFQKDTVSRLRPSACISCGRCLRACPEHLMSTKLSDFAEHGDKKSFEDYYGLECVECGTCSYVCPAKRPLAQNIRAMRRTILADRKKKK